MFCKNCGKEMKDSAAFCPECGAKTENQIAANIEVGSATAETAKKKYPTKLVIGAIIAAIVIIIIAIAASGGDDSDNVDDFGSGNIIIENTDYELGATYNMTPNQFIYRYNSIYSKVCGDSIRLPSIEEWIANDSGEGNVTYTYAVSKELIYTIFTYQDDKVTTVMTTLGENLIGSGALVMAMMECTALDIDDKNSIDAMYNLIEEKIYEGNAKFCYENSLVLVDGYNIRLFSVSDEVLDTMEYYSISKSELK